MRSKFIRGSGSSGNSNDGEEFFVYSPFRKDNPARSLLKMSGFDSNPFADPASDNPFNVSVLVFILLSAKPQSSLCADISFA